MSHSAKGALAVVIALCISLVACTPSQVVESLQLVTDAASAAVNVLGGGAVPAPVTIYLSAVNNGIICATTELQSSDTADVQAARIVACFATSIAPALPPGTPTTIASSIQAVSSALASFLAQYAPVSQSLAAAKASGAKPVHVSLSLHDKWKLGSIKKQASANAAKLQKHF